MSDAPLMRATEVSLRIGELQVLDKVSLDAPADSVVGLIGANGAGKSSMLNCLSGHYAMTSGQVQFDGHDVSRAKPHTLARLGLARTFQQSGTLMGMVARDVVMLGGHTSTKAGIVGGSLTLPRSRREERAMRERADLLAEQLGIWSVLDRDMKQLSYGHLKLVDLARALMSDPKLVLLDEPTSGVPASERSAIIELVERLLEEFGIAVVLVDHDVAFVRETARSVVVLDRGRQLATGAPDDVLANPAVQEAFLGTV